jgi:hypothetical protein
VPFLLWHFSLGDKTKNCSAQFLAVRWIIHVEFKARHFANTSPGIAGGILLGPRGVDLISDTLPFGRLWYGEPNAIGYTKYRSRSHDAVIRFTMTLAMRARHTNMQLSKPRETKR